MGKKFNEVTAQPSTPSDEDLVLWGQAAGSGLAYKMTFTQLKAKLDGMGSAITLVAPTLSASGIDADTIRLTIGTVANETSIEIQRSNDGTTGWSTINTAAANTTSYDDNGLAASTTRHYRVRSVGDGVTYLTSGWSSVANATTAAGGGGFVNNKSYNIAADNQRIQLASPGSFLRNASGFDLPFSVSMWVKISDGDMMSVSLFRPSGSDQVWTLNKEGGATNRILFFTGADYSNYLQATVANSAFDVWQHIVMTYDGSETFAGIKIYVNGVDQTLTNDSLGSYLGMGATVSTMNVGYNSVTYSRGLIDELAIFNRVLTSGEVTSIYNSGVPTNLMTSFASAIISYNRFEDNLTDSSTGGTHDGSATVENYSTDKP